MGLESLPLLKEVLGISPGDEDWLQYTWTCASPFGDFMAIASEKSVCFYVKKFGEEQKAFFKLTKTYCPEPEFGAISAITCFPVKSGGSGKPVNVWYCVVVGFQSGFAHFVGGDGQLLISKQFVADMPVVKIRVLNQLHAKHAKCPALAVPKLAELLIVYESTIVSIESNMLINSLLMARSEPKEGVNTRNLPARKCLVREQEKVNDIAAFSTANISFDQLRMVSMNKQLLNETHLKSLGSVTSFATTGQGTILQFNSPHSLLPSNINDLAKNVVSTVKSGLFRAAAGFFWSGGNQESQAEMEQVKQDPELKLEVRHSLKDEVKETVTVEVSPDRRYSAVFDLQNRVILVDNTLGIVLQMWKGYHHAQFGWISTTKDKHAPDASCNEYAILLVIYLPRRGLLEVWSPEQKSRVAHFYVSKRGHLFTSVNTVLEQKQGSPLSVREMSTAFLEPNGKILNIFIPLHAVTDKSSSHDIVLQTKLRALLEQHDTIDVASIGDLLKSAKTYTCKLQMMRDILLRESTLSDTDCRNILMTLRSQVESSKYASTQMEVLLKHLELYSYLSKVCRSDDLILSTSQYKSSDDILAAYLCTSFEAENLMAILPDRTSEVDVNFSRFGFMACFDLLHESEEGHDGIFLRAKNADKLMLSFLKQLGIAVCDSYENTVNHCKEYGLKGEELFQALLNVGIEYGYESMPDASTFFKLCQLCFDLHQYDEDGRSFQVLIQVAKKLLLKSPMDVKTYAVIFSWRCFLLQHQELSSYAEDWVKVLHLSKAFIEIKRKAHFVGSDSKQHSYSEVFESGNGKIVEVIVSWLIDDDRKLDCLDETDEELRAFLDEAASHFPSSMHRDILAAHMCWENCHRWNKDRQQLSLLEDSYDCLKGVHGKEIQHRLVRLLWNVILCKPVRDAVNLTEIRSATRCERDLGFGEEDIPRFVQIVCKLLTAHQDTLNETADMVVFYDVTSSEAGSQRHLIDILAMLQVTWERDSIFMLYHQMIIATCMIWHFGISSKPLSLFSNFEASLFFQSGYPADSQNATWASWSISQNRGVASNRKKFLEKACEGAIASIQAVSESEIDTSEYVQWSKLLSALGQHWNLSEKLSEIVIVAMYKAGHDSLGEEMMSTVADKEAISRRLLRLAMVRLTRSLTFHNSEKKILLNSEVQSMVDVLSKEVDEVAEVNLSSTANLLVALSNNDLNDTDQQNVYEWLAVAQTLIRTQM